MNVFLSSFLQWPCARVVWARSGEALTQMDPGTLDEKTDTSGDDFRSFFL